MDNVLDGFEVIEDISTVERRYKWESGKILNAFLDSGEACLGKRYGDNALKAYRALKANAIRRHMPVTVRKRDDMVFLVRKEGGDD